MILRLGTRGSRLALAQATLVTQALKAVLPELEIQTVVIRTSGDAGQREVLGSFVREIQHVLLRGEIEVAVHSLKDVPTEAVEGLMLGAVLEREDARDAVIERTVKEELLVNLPLGAKIGTGSSRRSAQLKTLRPDLEFLPLVGNVDTRLGKLERGDYDAIVLAMAGLKRLGLVGESTSPLTFNFRPSTNPQPSAFSLQPLSIQTMTPAPAQGAIGLECRADDAQTQGILNSINHADTYQAVVAEKAVSHALGGSCRAPVAAYAMVEGKEIRLIARVLSPYTGQRLEAELSGAEPVKLGEDLAEILLAKGAGELLA
jgi:hydroxymethylbilane synthase